jgi:hypothetical protein
MRRKWKKRRGPKPEFSVPEILASADEFHRRKGHWPTDHGGVLALPLGENWRKVDSALRLGLRGLAGGSSLARFLAEHRGKYYLGEHRGKHYLGKRPSLTVDDVLAWADAHYRRTGRWPHARLGGVIAGSRGEKWTNLDMALRKGFQGLPGGTTLARLLADHRGKRNLQNLPRLKVEDLLAWADAHHQRTGHWPTLYSGPIAEAPGETWRAVHQALHMGNRGFRGGSSLAKLLLEKRGKRHHIYLPSLTRRYILALADQYFREHGAWPKRNSGPVQDASGGTSWSALNAALVEGGRGLSGGSSLAQLLAAKRGVPSKSDLPHLTKRAILAWAKSHFRRTGAWPTSASGRVHEAPRESWAGINAALSRGNRGLRAGVTLAQLLAKHRDRGRGLAARRR